MAPTPQALRDAVYPQETGEAFIYLLELEHEDFIAMPPLWEDGIIRLCNAEGAWNDALNCYTFDAGYYTYVCTPFDVQPPGHSDNEPQGKLTVPNVDQRIGKAVEDIDGPPKVRILVVLESDPSIVMGGPYEELLLQNVRGDALTIEGDLVWPQLSTLPWPYDRVGVNKYRAARRILS